MSRTEKTRPFHVKQDELRAADPYGFRRDPYGMTWRPEFGCGRNCKTCYGWLAKADDRRARHEAKRQAANWQREYE